jgi:hypothetical protein
MPPRVAFEQFAEMPGRTPCETYPSDDAAEALRLLRDKIPAAAPHEETKGGRGKKSSDTVTGLRGMAEAYTLARLKRDHAELAKRVVSGELSANAAAIEAGFRARTVQIRVTVEGVARFIRKYFSEDQRRELAAEIVRGQRENA